MVLLKELLLQAVILSEWNDEQLLVPICVCTSSHDFVWFPACIGKYELMSGDMDTFRLRSLSPILMKGPHNS